MADSKVFKLSEAVTINSLGIAVENFLRETKKMVAEGEKTSEGYIIQAKEEGGWKKFAGMDSAIQVQMMDMNNGTLNVQIGAAKWSDKALAAGAGAVLFAPLLGTAAFGAWKQAKLPQQIFEFIEQYILSDGKTVVVSMSSNVADAKNTLVCKKCHARNPEGATFCVSCGAPLTDTCPNCQGPVTFGTKFCPSCGTNVEEAKVIKCVECGEPVDENAKFCNNCGTKVEVPEVIILTCVNCNEPLAENAKFCNGCGTKVEVPEVIILTCVNCNELLAENAKFCNGCGTKVEVAE